MEKSILDKVSCERLKKDLFTLCRDPFSFRTVIYHLPWHEKSSLQEADEFILAEMLKYAPQSRLIPNKVRPFRCDSSKPLHHWYSDPLDDDPWYDANNIEVVLPGTEKADEIIQLISHKDSMSWINSPGAHDNAVGTIANMELVRVLASVPHARTIRVLFCNEEHWPWHSATYANAAKDAGDNIVAVLNQDCLCGKSDEELAAGLCTHAIVASTAEGTKLGEYMLEISKKYTPSLITSVFTKDDIGDDEGSFINAGFTNAVVNMGSFPYTDPQYHLRGDIPERVNIDNLVLSVQLILASILDMP